MSAAESMEQALINYYGRQGYEQGGTLVNIAAGRNVNPTNLTNGYSQLDAIGYWGQRLFQIFEGGGGI